MKSLNETLIDEALNMPMFKYDCCLPDLLDEEGCPVTIQVACPKKYHKQFEKWMEDTFEFVQGTNNDYEY